MVSDACYMYHNHDIWVLMARCAFHEATSEEQCQLQGYLQQNPELQQQYDWMLQVLKKEEAVYETDQYDIPVNTTIDRILSKAALLEQDKPVVTQRVILKNRRIWMAAASLVLLAGISYFLLPGNKTIKPVSALQPLAVASATREHKVTLLPDGSKVWLNAGSQLFFENDFKGNTREVRLVGEAFFDVVKNAARPFIVHVNEVNISVLGTAFNVKGYDEDKDIETTLYRGLVRITKNGDEDFQPMMLYPNQKMVIPKAVLHHTASAADNAIKNAITLVPIDSTVKDEQRLETAWIYGRLDFKGESLEQVALKMTNWYGVKFVFEDEAVKRLSFTGSFEKESLQQALTALQTANPFTYKINNNEVTISVFK